MSCRTTPAGSAFTTIARLMGENEGIMSDVATLSTFHALRREWQESPSYRREWQASSVTPEAYQRLVEEMTARIQQDDNLSDARKASILARLQAAATAEAPDASTVYALRNIVSNVRSQSHRRNNFIAEYAEDTGMTEEEARARFRELEESIDRSRSADNPATFTQENREAARNSIGTSEAGAVHAYATMREEAREVIHATVAALPRRIVRTPVNNTDYATIGTDSPGDGAVARDVRVVEQGYDPRTGRLELVIEDRDGNRTEHAYRNVGSHDYSRMQSHPDGMTAYWARNIRGHSWLSYTNDRDQIRGGVAPRCVVCGQFANTAHACPITEVGNVASFSIRRGRTSGQRVPVQYTDLSGNQRTTEHRIDLPLVADFRTAGRNGSIEIRDINAYITSWDFDTTRLASSRVEGELGIIRNPETNEVTYNLTQMRCECGRFTSPENPCDHVNTYLRAVQLRLTPPSRTPAAQLTPEQREERLREAQARAEAAASSDWTRNEEMLAEARKTWQENAEVAYAENFETFMEDYNKATTEIAAKDGKPAIPFRKNPEGAVFGDLATRESGRGFGMEIECEFPTDMPSNERREALQRIGQQLKEAGLTSTEEQQQYHAAGRSGYQDTHAGNWSWERDGSVSCGELVTPIMYDEPETWNNLEKAVQILKNNGAIATTKAGMHIHVGTGNYGDDVNKYGELAKIATQHEDVLFRLAQNPERGTHRQGGYTQPMQESPVNGWSDVGEIRRWQGGRTRIVNMTSVSGGEKDHVELRIWDSTLDPGTMQAQVGMSLAMAAAAERNAAKGGTNRPKEPLGAHEMRMKARGRRRIRPEDLQEDTATFRSFADMLYSKKEDKQQLVALFAATKWNKASRANKSSQEQDRYTRERNALADLAAVEAEG